MKHTLNILSCLLVVLQFACNNAATNSKTATSEKLKIDNQGVSIDYDDNGKGDTTILFLHGWGINKTYWSDQKVFFAKKYRVVTIDLPGFGKSGKNRKTWTVEDYGKDVAAVLKKLDLKNVVLVGHSMSGAIALETALNNPARVIGIVGVDNFKNYGAVETPKSKEETANFYKSIETNFKTTVTEFVNQYLFSPSTDSLVRKRVLYDIIHADTLIAVNALEQSDSYPIDGKLKSLKRPLFLINSDLTPTDTIAFRKNSISYHLLNIGPTGHYPMLEKPGDFNLLLQDAIEGIK